MSGLGRQAPQLLHKSRREVGSQALGLLDVGPSPFKVGFGRQGYGELAVQYPEVRSGLLCSLKMDDGSEEVSLLHEDLTELAVASEVIRIDL